MPESIAMKLGMYDNLNGALHKYLPSAIPTLQPLKLLRKNHITAVIPSRIFTKLGLCIMPHEAISTAYFVSPSN
jgi:hypothetical protein